MADEDSRRPHRSGAVVHSVVGAEGFRPTTPASQTLCATRLRYAPRFAAGLDHTG